MRASARLPLLAAIAGFVSVAFTMLLIAGAPLDTDDLWWHLTAGETFAKFGPWPPADPSLHTAHAAAPLPQEWLFGIGVHELHAVAGFFGLRASHALAVLAVLLLVLNRCRRDGGGPVAALLMTGLFVVLAHTRLAQLRPDLVSIAATVLVYDLLLASGTAPAWPRVVAAALLTGLWANVHSLFLLGPIYVATGIGAIYGRGMLLGLARRRREPGAMLCAGDARLAARLGAALLLMLAASLVNPQGFDQLRFFFVASEYSNIWAVGDEWSPFNPFLYGANNPAVTRIQWILANLVLGGFAVASGIAIRQAVRKPAASALGVRGAIDFAVGLASIVAMLITIRFLWLSLFPLLFVARVLRLAGPGTRAAGSPGAWTMAAGIVAVAAAFSRTPAALDLVGRFSARPASYLTTPYRTQKYHVEGMRFLAETGLEGNLFNSYWMGGFAGFWLAPRLKTFIEGRTVDVPEEVIADHFSVLNYRGREPGETLLDILERRGVDIFFGVGYPGHRYPDYTTVHLERTAGWILVSRSYRHAIYLRENERNRANLRRVVEYYERRGVPFDPRRGIRPGEVIGSRAGWAVERFMVPAAYPRLLAATGDPDRRRQRRARDTLAVVYLLSGAYGKQVALDRETRRRFPNARGPRRRIVYGLLRLDRTGEALSEARSLVELDLDDRWSLRMLQTAIDFARIAESDPDPRRRRVRQNALLWGEFPASRGETRRVEILMGSEAMTMSGAGLPRNDD